MHYDEKARAALYNFYRSDVEEEMAESEVDLAALNAKLKGGGDLFHRVGAIAAFACAGSKRCHEHILAQLTLQKSGIGGMCTQNIILLLMCFYHFDMFSYMFFVTISSFWIQ